LKPVIAAEHLSVMFQLQNFRESAVIVFAFQLVEVIIADGRSPANYYIRKQLQRHVTVDQLDLVLDSYCGLDQRNQPVGRLVLLILLAKFQEVFFCYLQNFNDNIHRPDMVGVS
jgi:hypothetical protein